MMKNNPVIEIIKISAFLFLIIFMTYGETIRHAFVWDDQFFIDYDFRIRDLDITNFFTSYFFRGQYYRPFVLLSFALNWQLVGANPVWFHFANVMLHWGTTLLVFFFLRRFLRDDTAAIVGATIFGVHPLHTENIALISAQGDILAAFFTLAGFLSYSKYQKSESPNVSGWYLITILFYTGALFSKEMALVFPILLFSYDCLYKNRIRIIKNYLPFVAVTVFYFTLRYYAIGTIKGISSGNSNQFFLIPQIAFTYFRLFVFPVSLRTIYAFDIPSGILDFKFIGALVFVFSIAIFFFYLGRNKPTLIFGFLFICISLLPVLNFIPLRPPLAERFAYLPSIGFVLIMGYSYEMLQEWLSKHRLERGAYFIFLLVVCVCCFLSLQRNAVWKNNITLWESVSKQYPDMIAAKMNLALSYFDATNYEQAITIYNEVLKEDSTDSNVLKNLSKSLLYLGDTTQAIGYLQKAIHTSPSVMELYFTLNSILNKQGKTDVAIKFLQSARNEIKNPALLLELGNNYIRKENIDSAITAWRDAIVIDSAYEPAYRNLASTAFYLKDYLTAENYWQRIISINPDAVDIYWYWAFMKKSIGNADSSLIIAQNGYKLCNDSLLKKKFERLIQDLEINY